MRRLFSLFAVFALGLTLAGCDQPDTRRSYILTTASTGGTFYPVGVAISTLVKMKLQDSLGISMSAINSAGSGENVKLLRRGEAQFAIVQGLYGVWARTGQGAYGRQGPQLGLRGITTLWPNVEHFVVRADLVKTGTLQDLLDNPGIRLAVGTKNSGAVESTRMILRALGVEGEEHFKFVFLSYNAAADALQNGTIDAMSVPAGAPVSAITQAFASMDGDIVLLSISDDELAKLNQGVDLWTRFVVKAGTYPGQTEDIATAAQPNFLAVNGDVPDDVVYAVTKTLFENLAFLRSVHKATRVVTLERAFESMPVPLHPGAARYFREMGLTIPDRLLAVTP